jgi:predicted DNA-binding mobile mystery protein A
MTSPNALARLQLDSRLEELGARFGQRPSRGWIHAIRRALGMSATEMGRRMQLTQSRVSQIERGEVDGTITISTLERAAAALDCQLRYVLLPNTSLETIVQRQAFARAAQIMGVTVHQMELEDQRPESRILSEQLKSLATELVDSQGLWKELG